MIRNLLYIIIGTIVVVMILVGIGIFVLLPQITSASTPPATPTAVASPTTSATKTNTVASTIRQYLPDIKSKLSQGLHLTSEQLTTQLRSGKTLTQIATAQGVSGTQLQSLIATTFTTSLQAAVDSGNLTQKQVSGLVKRYQKNPDLLDKLLSGKTTKTSKTLTLSTG